MILFKSLLLLNVHFMTSKIPINQDRLINGDEKEFKSLFDLLRKMSFKKFSCVCGRKEKN